MPTRNYWSLPSRVKDLLRLSRSSRLSMSRQLPQVLQHRLHFLRRDGARLVAVFQRARLRPLDRDLADGRVALQGFLHQRRALSVADQRIQRRDDDGVLLQPALGLFAVGFHAAHGLFGESARRPDCDLHLLEQFVRDHRHHHVQFQLPGLGRQRHRRLAPGHVEHRHVQHLGHHRVDFARHDARTGLHRRELDLVQPGGGTRGQQAEIVGDADQRQRQGFDGGRERRRVGHGLHRLEQVVGRVQPQPRQFG